MRHVPALIALFAALAACSGKTPDGARIDHARAEAQQQSADAARLEALLSDRERSIRWREEHTRWASIKASRVEASAAERETESRKAVHERPDLLEQLLELRRNGAMAPPDKLPPALELILEGSRVGLRNASGGSLRVQATRLLASKTGYPLNHCRLESNDTQGRRTFDSDVAPGATVYLYESRAWDYCSRGEKKMPLEVAVWRDDALVWITGTRVHDLLNLQPEPAEDALQRAELAGRR